jgi:glycosyltransferase involved in cell wall biosynthesis
MNAQEVVALSPGMAEGVVRMGFPRDRTTVIPNSADLDLFSDSASSMREVLPDAPDLSGRKLIVYCGTFGRVNKVTYIAEIAAEARKIDPSLVFFAIGDGAECDLIRDTAKAMGVLGHNMFLYPPIKKVEVPSLLKAAALSLSLFADVPEMQNNSANKFFDTLAAGRPIGINYQGWQAELIRSGGIGIVLPSTDPAAAAREISGFLADAEAVESAGIRARRMAETHFDRDILARNLNEVLVRARSEFRSRI